MKLFRSLAQHEETLVSVSPNLAREVTEGFAQRRMDTGVLELHGSLALIKQFIAIAGRLYASQGPDAQLVGLYASACCTNPRQRLSTTRFSVTMGRCPRYRG